MGDDTPVRTSTALADALARAQADLAANRPVTEDFVLAILQQIADETGEASDADDDDTEDGQA